MEGTNFENGVLIGDGGDACLPYLMTPYSEPVIQSERRYNRALKVTRSLIERTFGVLKRRFHVLHSENRMSPDRVCTVVVACCILHNIAIDNNEPLPDFEDDGPWNEDQGDDFVGIETGQAVRAHIANTYFQ